MSVASPQLPLDLKVLAPPPTPPKDVISKEDLEKTLSNFLKAINFHVPENPYDRTLEEPVIAHFRTKDNWPTDQLNKAIELAEWISTGIGMYYPYASKHSQICYGIFTTYYVLIDDMGESQGELLQDFSANLMAGKTTGSPVLESLVEWLSYGEKYLGPFANAMSNKCSIEFLQSCFFEIEFNGKIQIPKGALGFPGYFRMKTGITEPYAFFAFPEDRHPEKEYLQAYLPAVQDLCTYINHTNDILSFYKESVVGDEGLNFICNYAAANGLSLLDAVRESCDNVVRSVGNVRMALKDHPQLRRDADAFINGFACWHVLLDRYKLGELKLEY